MIEELHDKHKLPIDYGLKRAINIYGLRLLIIIGSVLLNIYIWLAIILPNSLLVIAAICILGWILLEQEQVQKHFDRGVEKFQYSLTAISIVSGGIWATPRIVRLSMGVVRSGFDIFTDFPGNTGYFSSILILIVLLIVLCLPPIYIYQRAIRYRRRYLLDIGGYHHVSGFSRKIYLDRINFSPPYNKLLAHFVIDFRASKSRENVFLLNRQTGETIVLRIGNRKRYRTISTKYGRFMIAISNYSHYSQYLHIDIRR